MDEKTLRMLEFDKVRDMLTQHTSFTLGRERTASLQPVADLHQVQALQEETAQALLLLDGGLNSPLGGARDIRPALGRAERGAMLDTEELLAVVSTAATSRRLRGAVLRTGDHDTDRRPRLRRIAEGLGKFGDLEAAIHQAIGSEGEVLDQASPELAGIRSRIRTLQNRIRDRLESILRSASARRTLQDTIITLRNGRYVVPVKQEHKGAVPGIVHDQSASGATIFVEPMPVVEINNELREAESRERHEIERILRKLSAEVQACGHELAVSLNLLGEFDLIFARARLALEQRAVMPRLNAEGRLHILGGRHPLLERTLGDHTRLVPVDIWLGREFRALLITGPNTGGKTVTLKTTGLLTLMAQAGLHVPADSGTEMAVFANIYADIGDEQSIEQNLSTFSSHMANIVRILEHHAADRLVLLDELGAGTDPTEGAALAMAILEHLLASGCRTVATTHYSELKTFAYTEPEIDNASVEFDLETLSPTFRLSIGLPGRSNAFEIAHRLGLDASVLQRAKERLGRDEVQVEDLIRGLEDSRRAAVEDRSVAAAARNEAEELRRRYDAAWRDLQAEKRRMQAEARREARELVRTTREELETLIADLRRQGAAAQVEQTRQARARLAGTEARLAGSEADGEPAVAGQPSAAGEGDSPSNLQAGDDVYVRSLGQMGEVIAVPDAGGHVLVQIGSMRINARLADLADPASRGSGTAKSDRRRQAARPVGAATGWRQAQGAGGHQGGSEGDVGGYASVNRRASISTEIHLRGLTVDEALERTDKYLDEAFMAGLSAVRIVHGKGTGTLRRAVAEYLHAHPHVRSYRLGDPGEGGYGVTVAELNTG